MALPTSLSSMTTREAVIDAIYRCTIGLDTDNIALFNASFTDDAVLDLNGRLLEGRDAIQTGCYDPISKMDTTHYITNTRVDIKDGASEASVMASVLAQHFRPGEGKVPGAARYMAGGFYFIQCVKDETDGLWKAKHWKLKSTWGEGDHSVMPGN